MLDVSGDITGQPAPSSIQVNQVLEFDLAGLGS